MKIKNFQVFDEMNQAAVHDLMKQDLRGATALKVVKVVRKLDELLEDINKSVSIIRDRHSVKDESGNLVHPEENGVVLKDRVKIKDPIAFNKELSEILNIENDIFPDMEMISEEEIKGVNISAKNIMILNWLIKA
jgi:hypothetical protein